MADGKTGLRAVKGSKNLKAMETYYKMMGWDPETGVPRWGKLVELELDWLSS